VIIGAIKKVTTKEMAVNKVGKDKYIVSENYDVNNQIVDFNRAGECQSKIFWNSPSGDLIKASILHLIKRGCYFAHPYYIHRSDTRIPELGAD